MQITQNNNMTYYKFSNVTQGVKVQKTTQIIGNVCLTIEPNFIYVSIIESKKNIVINQERKGVEL